MQTEYIWYPILSKPIINSVQQLAGNSKTYAWIFMNMKKRKPGYIQEEIPNIFCIWVYNISSLPVDQQYILTIWDATKFLMI